MKLSLGMALCLLMLTTFRICACRPLIYHNFTIEVGCKLDKIVLHVNSTSKPFTGMIYPNLLFKSPACSKTYNGSSHRVTFELPLYSCNTMSTIKEKVIEFKNIVVVQPHIHLYTKIGQTIDIRCRFNEDQTIMNNSLSVRLLNHVNTRRHYQAPNRSVILNGPLIPSYQPLTKMRIYEGAVKDLKLAVTVDLGTEITMFIKSYSESMFGLRVVNCIARDGNFGNELRLIDEQGCPVDRDIMDGFIYASDFTSAHVIFNAHKFPSASVIYYECSVKSCLQPYEQCHITRKDCGDTNNKFDGIRMPRALESNLKDGEGFKVQYALFVNDKENYAFQEGDETCFNNAHFVVIFSAALTMIAFFASLFAGSFFSYCLKQREGDEDSDYSTNQFIPPFWNSAQANTRIKY